MATLLALGSPNDSHLLSGRNSYLGLKIVGRSVLQVNRPHTFMVRPATIPGIFRLPSHTTFTTPEPSVNSISTAGDRSWGELKRRARFQLFPHVNRDYMTESLERVDPRYLQIVVGGPNIRGSYVILSAFALIVAHSERWRSSVSAGFRDFRAALKRVG